MFNRDLAVIYVNAEAKKILLSLDRSCSKRDCDTIEIPAEITRVCKVLTKESGGTHDSVDDALSHRDVINSPDGKSYSIRPLLLDRSPRNRDIAHIMILLERTTSEQIADFEKV